MHSLYDQNPNQEDEASDEAYAKFMSPAGKNCGIGGLLDAVNKEEDASTFEPSGWLANILADPEVESHWNAFKKI